MPHYEICVLETGECQVWFQNESGGLLYGTFLPGQPMSPTTLAVTFIRSIGANDPAQYPIRYTEQGKHITSELCLQMKEKLDAHRVYSLALRDGKRVFMSKPIGKNGYAVSEQGHDVLNVGTVEEAAFALLNRVGTWIGESCGVTW